MSAYRSITLGARRGFAAAASLFSAMALLGAMLAAPAFAQGGLTERQIAAVAAAVDRYRDFDAARRDGWRRFGGDVPLMGEHWRHRDAPDYVAGDPLDFSRPTNLMYTDIRGERVLTGVAFTVRIADDEPLPEGFAGGGDVWHVHNMRDIVEVGLETRPIVRWFLRRWTEGQLVEDGVERSRLAMIHVWTTLPNPDGPFATFNRTLPYLKLGLPLSYADGASVDAARGLQLATQDGCETTFEAHLWLADADRAQRRTIMEACEAMAGRVRAQLRQTPTVINAVAAESWRFLDDLFISICTPDQRRRVASLVENGH